MIDPDTLTLGELAAMEEVTGLTIEETLHGLAVGLWAESAQFLLACTLVLRSREAPVTLEQVAATPFITFADEPESGT